MPVRKGFRGGVACPMWLLDCHDAIVIPLAKGKAQTNPIYPTKPGWSTNIVGCHIRNCAIEVTGLRFELAQMGSMLFLAAEVRQLDYDIHGWINIWQGPSWDYPIGTLYCALGYQPQYGKRCLCGSCLSTWTNQGWVCPLLQL